MRASLSIAPPQPLSPQTANLALFVRTLKISSISKPKDANLALEELNSQLIKKNVSDSFISLTSMTKVKEKWYQPMITQSATIGQINRSSEGKTLTRTAMRLSLMEPWMDAKSVPFLKNILISRTECVLPSRD